MHGNTLPALLLALACTAGAADNLLPWGDFTVGAKTLPESWKYASAKLISAIDEDQATALRFTALEGALVVATCERPVPAGAKRLTLTGSLKAVGVTAGDAPGNVGRVALQMFAGGKRVEDQTHPISGDTPWQKFTLTVACPANAEKFQVNVGSLKARTGQVLVKDLLLVAK